MPDPTIAVLDPNQHGIDPHYVQDNLDRAADAITRKVPPRFQDAVADHPDVQAWVREVVDGADIAIPYPAVDTGPSLLLLGPVGVGKTFQCYGAIRALAVSGVRCSWELVAAADFYASQRPRPRVDAEDEFDRLARVSLLVLDDLGAAKATEWTEEITYRLVNRRYQDCKPTIVTSNVTPKTLADALGERVASRLREMGRVVALKGSDRRRPKLVSA